MKYQFVSDQSSRFPVRRICLILGLWPSAYYAWRRRGESRRVRENRRLVVEIKAIHESSQRTYGSPRIHAELKARGRHHGKNRVARLMRENAIRAKQKRKFKATTDSRHSHPVAANLLQRNFQAAAANQTWLADITCIPTREGWLYLAAILDLHSRIIAGWSMADRMTRTLALDALAMAVGRRNPGPGLVHHSDRGSQYACGDYQQALSSHGMLASMSRKGDCWDNAPMESFFHTLKTELVHHRAYQTRQEARADVFNYIETFYNRTRRHSALGFLAPAEFEMIKMAA